MTTWADPDHHGEGKIEATTKRMIDRDAEQSARDILDLFVRLSGGLRS